MELNFGLASSGTFVQRNDLKNLQDILLPLVFLSANPVTGFEPPEAASADLDTKYHRFP
jgi:hypothetical protein